MASYAVAPRAIIISKLFNKFTSINKFFGIFLLIEIFLWGIFNKFYEMVDLLQELGMYRFNTA
jgi:hypothetical protein